MHQCWTLWKLFAIRSSTVSVYLCVCVLVMVYLFSNIGVKRLVVSTSLDLGGIQLSSTCLCRKISSQHSIVTFVLLTWKCLRNACSVVALVVANVVNCCANTCLVVCHAIRRLMVQQRVDGSTVCLTLEAPIVEVALANCLFRPS